MSQTVVATALNECAHVADVMNFLRLAVVAEALRSRFK